MWAAVLTLAVPASGQDVVRATGVHVTESLSYAAGIAQDREWDRVWVGFTVPRTEYGGMYYGGNLNSDRRTLEDVLDPPTVEQAARRALLRASGEETETTAVAVLLQLEEGSLRDARIRSMGAPAGLGGQPLVWLGEADPLDSLPWLMALLDDSRGELREDLVSAIGLHELPDTVVPFLFELAHSDPDEEVRERARFWMADAVASRMGLMRGSAEERDSDDARVQRSAVYALVNSDEAGAPARLERLIESGTSKEVKRHAVLNLAYLDDGRGLPALEVLARRAGLLK